jgi:hypothetical protein
MSTLSKIKSLFGFIAVVSSLFVSATAQGMDLFSYDLDSLVYMGPQIIEGRLGVAFVTNNFTAWEFKISAVYSGDFKVGQSVDITALGFFCVSKYGPFGNDPLKEGDQLFLFLARAVGDGLFYRIPQNAEIYWPAPSGVRLVEGEKALEFNQYNNPGPYLAILKGAATNPAIPTIAEFRQQIRGSIPRVDSWRPVLEQKPASNNVPALLQILRQRQSGNTSGRWGRDFLSEKVCQTLANLHDADALLEAAQISGYRRDLSAGFGTPAGRDFLRRQIADEHEQVDRKILCANLLAAAGEGGLPERHLERIAELAAQPKQNQKVQVALLDSMHQMARWGLIPGGGTNADPTMLENREETGAILTRLARESDSEEVKYEIDLVLPALGFNPLSSRNCLLQLDHYDPLTRKLYMRCHVSGVAGMNPVPIAFVNVKTGQKWSALSMLYFHGDETESPSDVVVPNDLPHGRYRVFYEFMQNGKVESTSHYFEADL